MINQQVFEKARTRAFKEHKVSLDRDLLSSLIRKVAKKKEKMRFEDALRFSLNESYLYDKKGGPKTRTAYKMAIGFYFGQINALAQKARSAYNKGSRLARKANETPPFKDPTGEPGEQFAFNI